MQKNSIISAIKAYQPIKLAETSITAAVIVLLMFENENVHLIMTKRSNHITTYAGDYCFPGGMREPKDADLKITAQREVEEELGLKPNHYQMIGELDDFIDRFGNLVRPFVALISKSEFEKNLKIGIEEIDQIYYFPVDELHALASAPKLEELTKRHPSYQYIQDDVMIWGLTASILVHVGNIIFHEKRRVDKQGPLHN